VFSRRRIEMAAEAPSRLVQAAWANQALNGPPPLEVPGGRKRWDGPNEEVVPCSGGFASSPSSSFGQSSTLGGSGLHPRVEILQALRLARLLVVSNA
jgi:hypothetical protein